MRHLYIFYSRDRVEWSDRGPVSVSEHLESSGTKIMMIGSQIMEKEETENQTKSLEDGLHVFSQTLTFFLPVGL